MNSLSNISLLNLIPSSIKDNPKIISAALTLDKEIQKLNKCIENINIYSRIDELDETLINELAWQFHVDFYDISLPLEVKRELVKNSIPWHRIKGTPAVLEQMLSTVYNDIVVEEWFKYGGNPYFFRVIVNALLDNTINTKTIPKIIKVFKNERSWLEKILFFLKGSFTSSEKYNLKSTRHRMLSTFGRKNGLILDGTWNLDGIHILDSGYRELNVITKNRIFIKSINSIYPNSLKLNIKDMMNISNKNRVRNIFLFTSNFWYRNELQLDGTWTLDGSKILNGEESYKKKRLVVNTKCITSFNNKEIINAELTVEKNWWKLNGNLSLDGTKRLSAERYKEVI